MATIKHITTPDGVTHDIGGGGGSSTYTLTKSGNTITLTGSGGDVSSVVDANTTYSLSISGDTLTLTPSSGSAQSVTIPDTDTTYTISISGSTITLTPSSGSAQTITIPDATTTSAGVMSASDKNKLNGIQSGAEVNVQSDWSQSDSTADDYIKNKPSIPTVNNGTLTIQQNGVTLDTFTANQSGNTTVNITASGGGDKNIWYATCISSYSTTAKTATTTTGDFVLEEGSMVRVKFSSYNTASTPTLNVDGTGAKLIKKYGTTAPSTRTWRTGEVVDFVYDGTNFIISDAGTASTDYYGYTKLSSSTSSTSTDLAATPSAVKSAYDLANSKSTVSVSQTISSGTEIGSVTVNGTATKLYAPSGGGAEAGITAGVITPYAGSTAPTGWLMCDGSAVSRTTYSELFSVIGTTYGAGDGSTTFNVPDLTGRFALGSGEPNDNNVHAWGDNLTYDGTNKYDEPRGNMGGESHHQLTKDQLPKIQGEARMGWTDSSAAGIMVGASGDIYATRSGTTYYVGATSSGSYYNTIGINVGNNKSHNNMPPYTAVNYIISIGSQNGGFTHITYDSGTDTYNGGIEDEYLLTDDTITALESWLNS